MKMARQRIIPTTPLDFVYVPRLVVPSLTRIIETFPLIWLLTAYADADEDVDLEFLSKTMAFDEIDAAVKKWKKNAADAQKDDTLDDEGKAAVAKIIKKVVDKLKKAGKTIV